MTALAWLDLLLALGFTLRLSRLVTSDTITDWWLRGPLDRWADRKEPYHPAWRTKLVSGLSCPICVGFWLTGLVVLSLAVMGGPAAEGTLALVWQYVALAFTLNYVAGHISARMD